VNEEVLTHWGLSRQKQTNPDTKTPGRNELAVDLAFYDEASSF